MNHCKCLAAIKKHLDTIVWRVRLVRTTMRKEVVLGLRRNCTHFRRRSEKVVDQCWIVRRSQLLKFSQTVLHMHQRKSNVRVGTIDRPFLAKANRSTILLKSFLSLRCFCFLERRRLANIFASASVWDIRHPMHPACVFIEKQSSFVFATQELLGGRLGHGAFVFFFVLGTPIQEAEFRCVRTETGRMTSFCDPCFVVVLEEVSRICRVMSHIGAWHKQSLSLFFHFNFVFSLPFFWCFTYFSTSKLFSLSSSLSFSLFVFLLRQYGFLCLVFFCCCALLSFTLQWQSWCLFRSFWWNARLFGPCFQQSVAYRWRLFCPWLVSIQPHSLVSHLALLWWGSHLISRTRSSVCALRMLSFVLEKMILMWRSVLADVTGNVVQSFWRDREAGLRQDIAAPTTAFRIWRTMDRGHFAEIVWFGRGVRTL